MKLLVALLAAAVLYVPQQGEIIEQVLVKVNGDIITKTDLERRQITALRDRSKGQIDAAALKNDAELRKVLVEITGDILVNAIDELLLVQMGKERGYALRDEQFQEWLANLRKEQGLQDEQKFQAALRQEGFTIDDLRRNLERNFLINRVQQAEIGSKLSITEEEARQYYLAHRDEFAEPATVTLREIMVTIAGSEAGVNVGAQDDAEKKIAAIRTRVTSGEDFGKVAAEVSDSPSKANGGLIGPLPLTDLSDALRKQIESMKPGDVTQPLRTARGVQLLKLETLKPASTQPFEAVRDLVADRVHDARQEAEVRKFLTRVRSQALIEWKNADLKKLYDQALVAAATQLN